MARSRNIKPGFFLNDTLAEIDPLGRLLFAGLWTLADREGRLEDRPKKIKVSILPYDNCNIDKLLDKLHDKRFIIRYEVDGNRYISITNWDKHQNPHVKESPSTIPEPHEHHTSTVQEQEKNETSRADSLLLIPDSLNLIPDSLVVDPKDTAAAFDQVIHEFLTISEKNETNVSATDIQETHTLTSSGIPPDFIIQAMQDVTSEYKQRNPKGKIKSMRYFSDAVREKWDAKLLIDEARKDGNYGGNQGHSSKNRADSDDRETQGYFEQYGFIKTVSDLQ